MTVTDPSFAAAGEPAVHQASLWIDRRRRAALLCVVGTGVAGAVLGVIWGLVVPGVRGFVIKSDAAGDLTSEAPLRFDALAMFAALSIVLGVVVALGIWQARSLRGLTGVITTAVMALFGAGVGAVVGEAVAGARFPGRGSTEPGHYYLSAPSLYIDHAYAQLGVKISMGLAILVIAPLAALLTLVIVALAQRDPDFGVGDGHSVAGAGDPSGGRPQGGELVGDPHPRVGETVEGGGPPPAGAGPAEGAGGGDDAAPAQNS